MLRRMKKGNDVLLLQRQGNWREGEGEGEEGRTGGLEEEALRSFWSQSGRTDGRPLS